MVLPQSGNPISLLNLQLEYDDTAPTSLNEFYGQAQAPASGTIDLADFYAAASTAAVTSNLVFELDARNSSSYSGSGTTWYDTTSNNRDFTLVNGPSATTVGGVSAIDFDGTNDYAEISDGTWIPDGTNPWTCEVYVYIDDWDPNSFAASERLMFTKTSPSNQGMSLGFDEQDNGNLHMLASTQGGGNVSGATHYYNMGAATNYEGVWFHAVWTYDGSNLTFYIDGSQVATWSGRNFHSNSAPLRLMCLDPSNSSYSMNVNGKWKGIVRMYSAALSSSNVTTNRANCTGGATAVDSYLSVTPSSHQNSAFTATFTFDQNVGNFDTNDITVTNGTKGTFTATSKKVYTLAITPTGTSDITITVPAGASINAANLDNNAVSHTVTYSTEPSGTLMNLNSNNTASYNGSGTTWFDVTSNNYDWTLVNGPTWNGSAPKHFSFDGSNDWATNSFTVSSSTDCTWMVWHRPHNASQNTWSALLGFRYGSTNKTNILGFKSSNQYQYHWNDQYFGTNTGLTISANRWEMITLRINSTSAVFDQKYSTTTNTFTNTASHGTFHHSGASGYIGRDPESSGRIYSGDIQRIMIWDRRLSNAEVAAMYALTKGQIGY